MDNDMTPSRIQAKLNAMLDAMVDQEVLLAGLVAQAKAEAAARPDAGRIGLPVVPDPLSPQPPPSGTFRGRYVCRDESVVVIGQREMASGLWDSHGNHITTHAADLMRRIREGEGQ